MIVFVGTGYRIGDGLVYTNGRCRYCDSENAITVLPYYKYFHIFWLPVIPIGKKYEIKCQACDREFDRYQVDIESVKNEMRFPLWTFAGSAIILVFGAYMLITDVTDNRAKKAFLKDTLKTPEKGVLLVMEKDDRYSLLRISGYTADSVFVQTYSRWVKNKKHLKFLGLYNKDHFLYESKGYSKQEMLELVDDDVLLEVYAD